jgi:hypothetical protein
MKINKSWSAILQSYISESRNTNTQPHHMIIHALQPTISNSHFLDE